jgi:ubiquinone/menaquinone biosynthesis C-methylase UbiE
MSAPDVQAFKAAMRDQWDRSAQGWNKHSAPIGAWLARATDAMLTMAGVGPGARAIDEAAGSGEQTLTIADRVGPSGFVLASDLSPAVVALAQANMQRAGHRHVQVQVADGEQLGVEAASFDAAVSRLGVMSFPNPLQRLIEMRNALRPGGGIGTMVFAAPERNPCITDPMSTAMKHARLPPRDPYRPGGLLSLGKPGWLDSLFKQAGLVDVATTSIDAPFKMPSVRHCMDFIRSSASPVLQLLARLEPAAADAAWADIEQHLSAFNTATAWEGPNELLLTTGRR